MGFIVKRLVIVFHIYYLMILDMLYTIFGIFRGNLIPVQFAFSHISRFSIYLFFNFAYLRKKEHGNGNEDIFR